MTKEAGVRVVATALVLVSVWSGVAAQRQPRSPRFGTPEFAAFWLGHVQWVMPNVHPAHAAWIADAREKLEQERLAQEKGKP